MMTQTPSISLNGDIAQKWDSGDFNGALSLLWERHFRTAWGLAHAALKNPEQADDVLQEAAVKLLTARAMVRGETLWPYFRRIVWNTTLSTLQRKGVSRQRDAAIQSIDQNGVTAPGPVAQSNDEASKRATWLHHQYRERVDRDMPEAPIIAAESLRQLEQLVHQTLSGLECKVILALLRNPSLSPGQLAKMFGTSSNSISSRKSEALDKLNQAVKDYGLCLQNL